MRALLFFGSIGLTATTLLAQSAGVPPEWETRKLLEGIARNAQKLEPLVKDIHPASWSEKGAPNTYVQQWTSVHNALSGLKTSSSRLAAEPTRLALALDTLFRLDGLNLYLGSLASGVRRYQNPALADILISVADENSANRESLKQYALDLAASKEGELKVMEAEAQRCLSIIVKQPPADRPKPPASQKERK